MMPEFLTPMTETTTLNEQGARLAGPWDKPAAHCEGISTSTLCIVPVLWCTDHYRCWNDRGEAYLHDYGPYPCGGCVSVEGW